MLTIRSSRRRFAARLNSGVRCVGVSQFRVAEKHLIRVAIMLLGTSIVLSLLSRNLPLSFSSPIPVANFYDRVSGASASAIYFVGMYVLAAAALPTAVGAFRGVVLSGIAITKRLLCSLAFLCAFGFLAYLLVLMPASTSIGGGRFSMLLAACAEWSLAHGVAYGALFYSAVVFLALSLASLLGARSPGGSHT